EQLFDIRASLFALAARKAALTRNGDKVARLKRLSRMLESGAETPEHYAEASTEAALEIADLSDSPLLKDMLISFAERIARYTRLGFGPMSRRRRSLKLWSQL